MVMHLTHRPKGFKGLALFVWRSFVVMFHAIPLYVNRLLGADLFDPEKHRAGVVRFMAHYITGPDLQEQVDLGKMTQEDAVAISGEIIQARKLLLQEKEEAKADECDPAA